MLVTALSAASAVLVEGTRRHQIGDHVDAAVAGPVGQRAAQRGGDHLLGGALGVTARLRAVAMPPPTYCGARFEP